MTDNKTCRTCKHWTPEYVIPHPKKDTAACMLITMSTSITKKHLAAVVPADDYAMAYLVTSANFYCSSFEEKINDNQSVD